MDKTTKVMYVIIAFCTYLLPTLLVWTFLFKDAVEPTSLGQIIDYFLLFLVSGLGGIGIGLILMVRLLKAIEEADDEK